MFSRELIVLFYVLTLRDKFLWFENSYCASVGEIMTKKIKLFIYGSCVSRDFLEIAGADGFELVDYFARSSFASIGSEPIEDDVLLAKMDSPFQRRMVERDLDKQIFSAMRSRDFDFLLIDLIDERFNLAEYKGSYCTVSSEFRKFQDNKYRRVPFDSDEKFHKWQLGVKKFFAYAKKFDVTDKVLINKVFWSESIDDGSEFSSEEKDLIRRNNMFLRKAYEHLSSYVIRNQFIEYPKLFLKAKKEHKWGVAPFHYIDSFYSLTRQSLEQIEFNFKVNKDINSN